jgi:glycosyltransferase involved in cell wall biosynthesis
LTNPNPSRTLACPIPRKNPFAVDLLYISNGNIPSRWAHTVQIVKQCEAFGRLVPGFALVIPGDVRGWLTGTADADRELFRWYGIETPFPLRRLTMAWRLTPAALARPSSRLFAGLARLFVRLTRPRLVITRSPASADFALRDGIPTIFETHDGPGHPHTMDYIRRFAGHPSLVGIVTTSPLLKEAFCGEGIAPEQVVVSANAVDLALFADVDEDRAGPRRALGLEPEGHLVLYAGSLQEYKGIPTVIDAARRLPGTRFLLVGGDAAAVHTWTGRAAGLANIRFLPYVPNKELPRYMAAADVCLVPNSNIDRTARWTFSLKLYEYLAARRPVVASAIPSLAGMLSDGENALLVPPDDADALAAAIERLLADPVLTARLCTNGYALVSRCTWDRRAEEILTALAPKLLPDPA